MLVCLGVSQTGEDYQVPLMLSRAAQPFYITVHIPHNFPDITPTIRVMHRVVHANVKAGTYEYIGPCLTKWGPHSNLLSVVRTLHQEFELSPPIPEGHKDAQKVSSQMQGPASNSQVSDAPQIVEQP